MAGKRYGMVYNSNTCIGCQACAIACRASNRVPDGVSRLQVRIIGPKGTYPNLTMDFERKSCVQCENSPCISVCPTGASYKNADGVVMIDKKKCVGCKYCLVACPYQARFINPTTGMAEKCDFCYESRTSKGEKPACAAGCPMSAITFGDMNDSKSEVRQVLNKQRAVRPKEHLGTKPQVLSIPNWRGGE